MESRVPAVLEVLRGRPTAEVAEQWSLDADALAGWVRAFVESGTAAVTESRADEPDPAAEKRDRFLAAFAHEVGTPLAMARGWVAMLADGELPADQARDSLRRLHDALDRLSQRTFEVELLAELSLGRLALAPQLVQVSALTAELDGLDRVEGLGDGLDVVVDPALVRLSLGALWQAAGDPPTPRHRSLSSHTGAGWLELRARREAAPLGPRAVEALFAPFDLNQDGSGVRIGLHLARALAVAHGGDVGVDEDPDGTEFWMRLPVSGA